MPAGGQHRGVDAVDVFVEGVETSTAVVEIESHLRTLCKRYKGKNRAALVAGPDRQDAVTLLRC